MEDCLEPSSLAKPPAGFWPLVALLALVAGAKPILIDTLDPDLFWHLLVGRQLLTDGIGPVVDRISFSSIRGPWTPYSWLAEIAAYQIWDLGGYRLALAIHALMGLA